MERETLDLSAVGRMAAPSSSVVERPLTPREETWSVRYTDPEGRRHVCAIVSRVPDADGIDGIARATMGLAARVLSPGQVFDQLPQMEQIRIRAIATCAVQLRDIPPEVSRWVTQDPALWGVLAVRCEDHSARYFRRDAGESPEDAAAARVLVAAVGAPRPAAQRDESDAPGMGGR